jgi:hypothetical protein
MPLAVRPLLTAFLIVLAGALSAASDAHAVGPTVPARGKVLTGVAMGESLTDFGTRVGRPPTVWEHFIAFDRPYAWAIQRARGAGTRLMVHLSTADGQDQPGTISPRAIARGEGDRWLVGLRDDLARLGRPSYVRFLGEMNNCHNAYAPLSCGGGSRGAAYSARATIAAWRRVTTIMRGGSAADVQARLRRLRQPALTAGARDLPRAPIAMVWSPMTGGSPMVAALDPAGFWPGRRWVDWVGTSFYSRYPNFRWLTPFYQRFAARQRKPFMFAEWAMWSNGDPGFVRQLLAWTATHRSTQMLVYNQGNRTSGPFRLRHFPAAQRALRQGLRHTRFDA